MSSSKSVCICVYLGCRGIQILFAVMMSARVRALSATAKDNTGSLKMEVRFSHLKSRWGRVKDSWWTVNGGIGTRKVFAVVCLTRVWFSMISWCLFKLSGMTYSTGVDTFISSLTKLKHVSEGDLGLCCPGAALCANHGRCFVHLNKFTCLVCEIYWPAAVSLCCTWSERPTDDCWLGLKGLVPSF